MLKVYGAERLWDALPARSRASSHPSISMPKHRTVRAILTLLAQKPTSQLTSPSRHHARQKQRRIHRPIHNETSPRFQQLGPRLLALG